MTRGLATCAALAALFAACRDTHAPPPAPPPQQQHADDPLAALHWDPAALDWTRPIAPAPHDVSAFAGSLACKACHLQIYTSYARHSMARTGMRPIESVDPSRPGKSRSRTCSARAATGSHCTPGAAMLRVGHFVVLSRSSPAAPPSCAGASCR